MNKIILNGQAGHAGTIAERDALAAAVDLMPWVDTDTGDVYVWMGAWRKAQSVGRDPDAVATWSETTTADNAAATVTKAAEAGKSHYITSISGSFSAAAIRLATLKDGATTKGNFHVHNQREITFDKPLKITAGAAAELSLAASGTAGVIGAVTMQGYTI